MGRSTTILGILEGLSVGLLLTELEYIPDPVANDATSSTSTGTTTPPIHDYGAPKMTAHSHVLTRDGEGLWTPRLHMIRQNHSFIDKWLYASPPPPPPFEKKKTNTSTSYDKYLGVVRIPKTGSTSLLHFMNASSTVQTYNNYLNMDPFAEKFVKPMQNPNTGLSILACFYGARGAIRKAPMIVPKNETDTLQCGHHLYAREIDYWTKSLRYLQGPQKSQPLQVAMDMITMVRDPFDRYLSFFHYWRQVYPAWETVVEKDSPAYNALIHGDFETFVQSIAHLPNRHVNAMFQYEYLAIDAETAQNNPNNGLEKVIAMVQQLRVLPLLNECFDSSMYLLSARYPQFFPMKATADFLQSSKVHSNRSNKRVFSSPAHNLQKYGIRPVLPFDRDCVRELARKWLSEDHRFYQASKRVFISLLQETNFYADHNLGTILVPVRVAVQECLDKLLLNDKNTTTS